MLGHWGTTLGLGEKKEPLHTHRTYGIGHKHRPVRTGSPASGGIGKLVKRGRGERKKISMERGGR